MNVSLCNLVFHHEKTPNKPKQNNKITITQQKNQNANQNKKNKKKKELSHH